MAGRSSTTLRDPQGCIRCSGTYRRLKYLPPAIQQIQQIPFQSQIFYLVPRGRRPMVLTPLSPICRTIVPAAPPRPLTAAPWDRGPADRGAVPAIRDTGRLGLGTLAARDMGHGARDTGTGDGQSWRKTNLRNDNLRNHKTWKTTICRKTICGKRQFTL